MKIEPNMFETKPAKPTARRKQSPKTTNRASAQTRPHRGRYAPPPNETARGRFLRIGQARMVNALQAIRLLGNLSSDLYEVRESDVALMQATLGEAIDEALGRFKKSSNRPKLEETFKIEG